MGRIGAQHNRRSLSALALVLFSALSLVGVQAAAAKPPASLAKEIDKVAKRADAVSGAWGLAVVDVKSGEVWAERGGNKRLNLASNAKLFTTAAALTTWGPTHRFETEVRGTLGDGGVVTGDLYVVGAGDPGLSAKDIKALAKAVHKAGVRTVEGRLVVDDAVIAGPVLPPAYGQKETDSAYRPYIAGFGMDSNAVGVRFRPGSAVGSAARISTKRASPGHIVIDNRATTKKGKGEQLEVRAVDAGGKTRVVVTGTIGSSYKGGMVKRRVIDPALFAAGHLVDRLTARRVKWAGDAGPVRGQAPADAPVVVRFPGDRLAEHVRRVNFHSDNAMAETLFALLPDGALDRLIAELGVGKPASVTMKNGSGLYDADFATPLQVAQFLQGAHGHPKLGQTYLKSLPTAGENGTLKRRLKGTAAEGQVFAKTGTLEDVVTLSGYVRTGSGRLLAFSFLLNELEGGAAKGRRVQDALMVALADL